MRIDGRLPALVKAKANDNELMDEIFLVTLSRLPTERDRAAVRDQISPQLAPAGREEAFRDLFWALLNTKEFAFNH